MISDLFTKTLQMDYRKMLIGIIQEQKRENVLKMILAIIYNK